ncbi:MAG: universal stress protein [Clostridia bacterium]|nr:universal stress protein [Clostridia bacterium]
MQYKNILIPTDGTRTSEDIIDFICSIQKTIEAEVHVIYVIEVPRNLPLGTIIPEKAEMAKNAINRALEIAERYDVRINTSTIYSRTSEDSIISTAQELKCDVIAIAQDNQKLRIFSNTASNIYQRAKCNVWLFNNKL